MILAGNSETAGFFHQSLHIPLDLLVSQYHKGGPIIAVQVENEYGSFAKDKDYMLYVRKVRDTWFVLIFAPSFLTLSPL